MGKFRPVHKRGGKKNHAHSQEKMKRHLPESSRIRKAREEVEEVKEKNINLVSPSPHNKADLIEQAKQVLLAVEKECNAVGLYINAKKTKYMT